MVKTSDVNQPAKPKAPVSGSVQEGDKTVVRDDQQGTIGPVEPLGPLFISEGVRNDIEQYGQTIDPNTGRTLTKDDLKGLRK